MRCDCSGVNDDELDAGSCRLKSPPHVALLVGAHPDVIPPPAAQSWGGLLGHGHPDTAGRLAPLHEGFTP